MEMRSHRCILLVSRRLGRVEIQRLHLHAPLSSRCGLTPPTVPRSGVNPNPNDLAALVARMPSDGRGLWHQRRQVGCSEDHSQRHGGRRCSIGPNRHVMGGAYT